MSNRDLLVQLLHWIVEQLQSADPQVSHHDAKGSSPEVRRSPADNVDAILEQLRLLLCEQHFSQNSNSSNYGQQDKSKTPDQSVSKKQTTEEVESFINSSEAEQQSLEQDPTVDISGGKELLQEWEQLKAEMVQRRRERIAASKAEDNAYREVRLFAGKHGDSARKLGGPWIEMASERYELRSVLIDAEYIWRMQRKDRKAKEKLLEESIPEEERKIRDAFAAECRESLKARREEMASYEGKTPGYYATERKDATEPCGMWDGPFDCYRFERFCDVCNLTGIERTGDCPNYFQHWKWLEGLEEAYRYH